MSEQPTVCAVMLVNGRPEMVKRAVDSFVSQTYDPKRLYVYDTSADKQPIIDALPDGYPDYGILYHGGHAERKTIGALRNWVNHFAVSDGADLIAHFDSDDVSHPRRLEEQVALLQASGKQCVGYRDLLFWDTRQILSPDMAVREIEDDIGGRHWNEAWRYRNEDPRWCAGASMLYTRELWEACPFNDAPHEDTLWWRRNAEKCLGRSSLALGTSECDPRMVCGIHGTNTEAYDRAKWMPGSGWSRAREFDSYCEKVMSL